MTDPTINNYSSLCEWNNHFLNLSMKGTKTLYPLYPLDSLSCRVEKDTHVCFGKIQEKVNSVFKNCSDYNKIPFSDIIFYKDKIECLWIISQIDSSIRDIFQNYRSSILENAKKFLNFLGNFQINEEIRKKTESFRKSLKMIESFSNFNNSIYFQNELNLSSNYINVGDSFSKKSYYLPAAVCYKKSFHFAENLNDKMTAAQRLAPLYERLGNRGKALKYYHHYMECVKSEGCLDKIQDVYLELGNHFISNNSFEDYLLAAVFFNKILQTINGDTDQKKIVLLNFATAIQLAGWAKIGLDLDLSKKCLEYASINYTESLITKEGSNLQAEAAALEGLSFIGYLLSKYDKKKEKLEESIIHGKGALEKYRSIDNPWRIASCSCLLGAIHKELGNLELSKTHLLESVEGFSNIQHHLRWKYKWQISTFEKPVIAYFLLEDLLQNEINEALIYSDARRSRVLMSILSEKIDLFQKHDEQSNILGAYSSMGSNQKVPSCLLSATQMKELAGKLKTTFLVYSFNKTANYLGVWVVGSSSIQWERLSEFEKLPDEKKNTHALFQSIPLPEGKSVRELKKILADWYEILIRPIKHYLPDKNQQTLTIIPDDFLVQIPFSALREVSPGEKSKYLIENYPIAIAPSIGVLYKLYELRQKWPPTEENFLIIGDPTTEKPLEYGSKEIEDLSKKFTDKVQVIKKEEATTDRVLCELNNSSIRNIHLVCHGNLTNINEERPDTNKLFNGFLELGDRLLHAQEIVSLSLRVESVFMSACYSGRGNLNEEGNLGLDWAFLAAGSLSTISAYWQVPDTSSTVEIVNLFYKHAFGKDTTKLSKAKALQQAMITAKKNFAKRRVRQWAVFCFSGLDDID